MNPGINNWIIFPFSSLSNNENSLACCACTVSNIKQWKDLRSDHNSSLLLKPSLNLECLVNQFHNATPENSNDPENISSSKYYNIDKMSKIKLWHENKKALTPFYHKNYFW